jgi:hypothetical protein
MPVWLSEILNVSIFKEKKNNIAVLVFFLAWYILQHCQHFKIYRVAQMSRDIRCLTTVRLRHVALAPLCISWIGRAKNEKAVDRRDRGVIRASIQTFAS